MDDKRLRSRPLQNLRVAAGGVGLVAKAAARAALDRVLPGTGAVPLRATAVTPRWLEDAMGLRPGSVRSLRVLEEHSGTAARARIAVEADPDVPDHLFLKFTPHNYLQHMMMLVFELGVREVFLYQTLGDRLPVHMPHCYAARVDTLRGRNLMVLEDLGDRAKFRDIREPATEAEAKAVIDSMADQHAAFWETPLFTGELRPLTGRSPQANFLGDLVRRRFYGNMKGQAADLVPAAMKQQSRIVFERSADVDAFWAAQPQTVLHGDPHLGNLYFVGETPGFLDWQVATAGAGIRDLAYFASASVDPEVLRKIERSLVERYAARIDAAGIRVELEDLWTLYKVGLTEFYMSAVAASEAGERAQPQAVTRVGVERAVAAVEAHDSFVLLRTLVDAAHV